MLSDLQEKINWLTNRGSQTAIQPKVILAADGPNKVTDVDVQRSVLTENFSNKHRKDEWWHGESKLEIPLKDEKDECLFFQKCGPLDLEIVKHLMCH